MSMFVHSEPTSWHVRKLGDLAQILDHLRVPVNSEEREQRLGDVPYYGANGIQGYIDKPLFDEPLVLLAEDGGNFDDFQLRSIAYRINGPSWVNNHAHILRASDSSVILNFLFHALEHRDIRKYISGGTRAKLTQAELCAIEVLTPPTGEQARIAEVLDTLDESIRGTEAVIEKQRHLQDGLLLSLVSPISPPSTWARTSLGDVADWVSGGTPSKSFSPYWGGDIPWVSPKDMKVFLLAEAQDHLTMQGAQNGTKLVPRHSVLVVVRGMILAHTFPVCLTQREVAINQDVKAVVARPGVSGEFLGYWFRAHSERLLRLVSEATHGTKKIDLDDLKKFQMLLPPEGEQEHIAAILASGDAALSGEVANLHTLKAIKSGLSPDLLTSRVRTRPH